MVPTWFVLPSFSSPPLSHLFICFSWLCHINLSSFSYSFRFTFVYRFILFCWFFFFNLISAHLVFLYWCKSCCLTVQLIDFPLCINIWTSTKRLWFKAFSTVYWIEMMNQSSKCKFSLTKKGCLNVVVNPLQSLTAWSGRVSCALKLRQILTAAVCTSWVFCLQFFLQRVKRSWFGFSSGDSLSQCRTFHFFFAFI